MTSVNNLSSAATYPPQYQAGRPGGANYTALQGINASQPAASTDSDQVSLSNAARALQAQDANAGSAQSGSPDMTQEEQLLTSLTDKSLAALGIVSASNESSTQVTFDSVSYNVSSSASTSQQTQQSGVQGQAGGGQSSTQFSNTQNATFTGEGHIVTADGQDFEFQIELQLNQSDQGAIAGGTGNTESAAATAGVGPFQQQTSGASGAASANLQADSSTGHLGDSQTTQPNTSTPTINWDAILKQTQTLFDLLDSLAAPGTSSSQAQVSAAS
jgi:hypothetical protein